MLSGKKNYLFLVGVLVVSLAVTLFVVTAHAQFYSPYMGAQYAGYPYNGGYPSYGGGYGSPYGGGYGSPYGGSSYGYPYGGGGGYPYGGGGYPYGGYTNPYQQYYTQPNYASADLMLDSGDDGDDFTVDDGDTISIILSSNASTGYRWELDSGELDDDIVSDTSAQYYQGGYLLGSSGTEQWLFKAEDTGTTNIRLEYKRSGDSSAQDTFEVEITVE